MRLKQDVASLELVPAGGGLFEVTVDGELIYSKKATGEFPDPDKILQEARSRR